MTTIVVFSFSLFVAGIMVLIKVIELKRGKRNIFFKIIGKLDSLSISFVSTAKFRGLQLIQSMRYIVLVKAKTAGKEWFLKIQKLALDEYRAKRNEIMGQKEIINRGSVSFFLKKITKDRENGNKGKIEESL